MAKSLLSKIGRFLKGRPKGPKLPPRVGMGHRGIAAGSLKYRQQRQAEGEAPFTQEEIAQWKEVTGDEATDFVYHQMPLIVHSSNVASLTYFIDEKKLLVEFHGGKRYIYSGVSEQEATQFVQAQSKGGAVWDLLRVRGSRTAHQKPFTRL